MTCLREDTARALKRLLSQLSVPVSLQNSMKFSLFFYCADMHACIYARDYGRNISVNEIAASDDALKCIDYSLQVTSETEEIP